MTTTQQLQDQVRVLKHRPGTAGYWLETRRVTKPRKSERKKAAKAKPKSKSTGFSPESRERTARVLALRANEHIKALHSLLSEDQKRSVPATPVSDRVLKPRTRVQAVGAREYTTQEIAAFRRARMGQVERITSAPSLEVRR